MIARSRFNRLWLKCDRGGTYENRRNLTPEQRKRKRGESRLLGCEFKMLASAKRDGIWKVETEVAEHNHGPSEDLSAHPTLRRMTDEQVNKVNEMCDNGRSPAETLEELRTLWPDIKVLTRDIYNARKKHKTEKELAAQAAGQPEEQQRPFEDPNGVFPGPSTNGRWAWLEDGDEVLNKKSKRRRRTAPAPSSTVNPALDPQLQVPTPSHSSHRPLSDAGQQLLNDFNQNHPQPVHNQPRYGAYDSAPNTFPRPPPINGPADHFGSFQDLHDASNTLQQYPNHQNNTTPSRLRSQRQNAPTASMSATPNVSASGTVGGPKAQTGQMIARIDGIEKEVRDQRSMLEQILGAVKGSKGVLNGRLS